MISQGSLSTKNIIKKEKVGGDYRKCHNHFSAKRLFCRDCIYACPFLLAQFNLHKKFINSLSAIKISIKINLETFLKF